MLLSLLYGLTVTSVQNRILYAVPLSFEKDIFRKIEMKRINYQLIYIGTAKGSSMDRREMVPDETIEIQKGIKKHQKG